ncbi:MAG: TonB-dependent receptor plug domain-containing protein [Acidobacteria bacterium]|nr:TonB-dependent receptor plug domain-containing protein [Acidobacteriota bacterium]
MKKPREIGVFGQSPHSIRAPRTTPSTFRNSSGTLQELFRTALRALATLRFRVESSTSAAWHRLGFHTSAPPSSTQRKDIMTTRYSALLGILLCSLAVAPLGAQESTIVAGTVTDSSGGVLPGATIEALRGLRVISTATAGADGRFQLDLPSGERYRVTARLDGFAAGEIDLIAADDATADFRLGIAPLTDTVVVTASRTAEGSASVMDSHSVFTEDDIETLGSHSVADVLRYVPGLNIESTGREGQLASVFARGGESDYNHVMIDGVRVNANGGYYDFSRVSANEIERVEVVRGAQSALYGSDAIGSVIQIFTKRGAPDSGPGLAGSIEGGSFGTARGDLRVLGGAQQRVDYQLGVAYRGTDGAFGDRLTERDRFDQHSIDGNVGAIIGDSTRLRTGFRYSNARANSVGPITYAPGDTGTGYDTDDLTWHFDFDQTLSSRIDHSATVSYFRSGRESVDAIGDPQYRVFAILEGTPGALYPAGPRLVRLLDQAAFDTLAADPSSLGAGQFLAQTGPFSGFDWPFEFEAQLRRPAARYQLNAIWMGNQVLSAGYDYYSETNALDELQTVANHSYFVQQQFNVADAWFVTAGTRIDDNAHYGASVNPKLSAGGYPLPFQEGPLSSLKVSANIGRGIKNPSFSQLYSSQWVDGNLLLLPEEAVTVDAGAELTFDDQRWLASFTWFNNNYENQIAYSPSPGFGGDGLPDYVNIDGSRAGGIEFEFGLQRPIGGLTANASYALVDTEVVTNVSTSQQFQPGQPLLRRPLHSGNLRVGYTRGRGSLNLNLRVVGNRHDSAFLGLVRASDGRSVDITVNPGYTLLTLGGQFRVHQDLTLFLRIDNVTDEMYDSALGYPALPRAVVAGGRFNVGG